MHTVTRYGVVGFLFSFVSYVSVIVVVSFVRRLIFVFTCVNQRQMSNESTKQWNSSETIINITLNWANEWGRLIYTHIFGYKIYQHFLIATVPVELFWNKRKTSSHRIASFILFIRSFLLLLLYVLVLFYSFCTFHFIFVLSIPSFFFYFTVFYIFIIIVPFSKKRPRIYMNTRKKNIFFLL